ncbi:MAG: hypothetical protein A3F70_00445 [Acidobacteria bacterium RIFCSPLOWO2_12_FULL_67_14]|nr:MAG: hypothetical protein A3H29_17505 [Acidobacteria bacterium RIFCSPLOWO2_02_FULL_67_21]OFW41401.1 MAG: hypothetical protein A3F70_00445 [Acidobacteria bacterium RIFCSPLOWO2_12_FULL_67_14]
MNLHELQTLVDYHYWARDRLLDAVERLSPEQLTRDLGNSFPSIRDTLVHLYGAERIWCARWEAVEAPPRPDPGAFADLAAIRRAWSDLEGKVRAVLDRLGEGGLTRSIAYRTMDGTPASQPFWQMLQHVVNHGSYHRGQVTTMLRQLGAAPARSMDLIAFYRERAA